MVKPKGLKRSEKNQFLNHMHNELHITKDDIEEMINRAVEARIDRIIKQYSVYDLIMQVIRYEVKSVFYAGWPSSLLQNCILKFMKESVSIVMKETPDKSDDNG